MWISAASEIRWPGNTELAVFQTYAFSVFVLTPFPRTVYSHHPQIDNSEPFGKIEGPCVFGGCFELCCDFRFNVSKFKTISSRHKGNIAVITKAPPPAMLGGAAATLLADTNVYTITFDQEYEKIATPSQKVTVLSAQILADYIYFNGNTEECKNDANGLTCICCYWALFGFVAPCCIYLPKQQ